MSFTRTGILGGVPMSPHEAPRPAMSTSHLFAAGLMLLSLLACHHPRRDNPMDPELTPPVELFPVSINDTTGIAVLAWTRYQGAEPFAEYRVLRNEVDRTSVATVGTISDVTRTSYVDTSIAPNTEYEYRIAVVNAEGLSAPSSLQRLRGYSAGPVGAAEVEVDDRAGSAMVRWQRYRGGRFEVYRVERRDGGNAEFVSRGESPSMMDTVFVDRDVPPNMDLTYRVVVVAAGRDWQSPASARVSLGIAAAELLPVEVDELEGSATVRWRQFLGPRFVTYRLERTVVGEEAPELVTQRVEVEDTVCVDRGIRPGFVYRYQVIVDAAGGKWPSNWSDRASFSLTPVRLLSGQVDSLAGVIRLTWSRFAGPGFENYQIRRQAAGAADDVVEERSNREDTTFVDQTVRADVDYDYKIAVNVSSQADLLSEGLRRRLRLPAVRLLSADFKSSTATATLRWSKYSGPRFLAYKVTRRTAVLSPQVVGEIRDIAQTSLVDSKLAGNTEYTYQVVVMTDRGEEVPSEERGGKFHRPLAIWPLDVADDEYGRLYSEPDDRIVLLLASRERVRLLIFGAEGHLVDEQVLYKDLAGRVEPRSVATALTPEGNRFLSMARDTLLALIPFDRSGRIIMGEEEPLFVNDLPDLTDKAEGTILGEITLETSGTPSGGYAVFDNVAVAREGNLIFEDDFENSRLEGWKVTGDVETDDGQVRTAATGGGFRISRGDPSWRDAALGVDVTVGRTASATGDRSARMAIGGTSFSRLTLMLNFIQQRISLSWTFASPPEQKPRYWRKELSKPHVLIPGIPYRLGLGIADGKVKVSVRSPVFWVGTRSSSSVWGSLAVVNGSIYPAERITWFFTEGSLPYIGTQQETRPLNFMWKVPGPVSEIRVWEGELSGTNGDVTGICLPSANRLLLGLASVNHTYRGWPFFSGGSGAALGGVAGHAEGELLYPISFDASPDGRIFVLDAGNARIQVFDSLGSHLTQWGRRGSAAGEFDFGRGGAPEDFKGSIAVDSEGSIYVLEMGNRRIQKFER